MEFPAPGYLDSEEDDDERVIINFIGAQPEWAGNFDFFPAYEDDFDDFDDDYYDDPEFFDSDFSNADTDDDNFSDAGETEMIFQTLQDSSAVLPQIQFLPTAGAGRLPRLSKSRPETYETLHQVSARSFVATFVHWSSEH